MDMKSEPLHNMPSIFEANAKDVSGIKALDYRWILEAREHW